MKTIALLLIWALLTGGAWSGLAASSEKPLPRLLPAKPAHLANPQTGWDPVAAARFLDQRMDMWFARAKKLRTDQSEVVCVSCHAVLPYCLARPALRKAAGVSSPTPQETRVLDEIVRRVKAHAKREPLYKSESSQSRGTEAVLDLLILAREDARRGCLVPSEPSREALDELWKEQRPDGAWAWLEFGLEPYEAVDSVYYGAALAALAVGTLPGYEGSVGQRASDHIARLRAYLSREHPAQNPHNQTWLLLASCRLRGLLTHGQREALIAELRRRQNADGGWSLYRLGPWTWSKSSAPSAPPGKPGLSLLSESDGYATGLVVYALRQAGLPRSHPMLQKAIDWLIAGQRECQIGQYRWRCWRAFSLNHAQQASRPWEGMFMSEGATGFAVLALLPSD
jgi:squalene-hopene/tetraprenyl-beta-curcumene cyclase